MKASAALKRAQNHLDKAKGLMLPVSEKLSEILDDDCAHVSDSTDGIVIAYRGGMDNARIATTDIDRLLTLNKDELLDELDKAGI